MNRRTIRQVLTALAAAAIFASACSDSETSFLGPDGQNRPPSIGGPTFTSPSIASGSQIQIAETITFSATASDENGIKSLTWDFGDGAGTASASPATYAYAAGGTYTVAVTATDSTGRTSVATTQVFVNTPPTVTAIGQTPLPGFSGQSVSLTANVVDPDAGDGISLISWDFGDSTTGPSAGATTTHTYAVTGTFTVTATVTDANGGVSTPFSGTVLVSDVRVTSITINGTAGAGAGVIINATPITVTGGNWSHTAPYGGSQTVLNVVGSVSASCLPSGIQITVETPQ